jgi:Zn-dependent peptidase ImmA (M78 family)
MDAAHELGHIVLHRGESGTRSRRIEEEAKRFASAFLMPGADLVARGLHFATIEQLIVAKRRWKVALSALALRLHALGVISEWHYRSLCVDISRRGYRKQEPNEASRETSQILAKVLGALREEGVSRADIARDLHLTPNDLNALMFGLAMTPIEGQGSGTAPTTHRRDFTIVQGGAE